MNKSLWLKQLGTPDTEIGDHALFHLLQFVWVLLVSSHLTSHYVDNTIHILKHGGGIIMLRVILFYQQ